MDRSADANQQGRYTALGNSNRRIVEPITDAAEEKQTIGMGMLRHLVWEYRARRFGESIG